MVGPPCRALRLTWDSRGRGRAEFGLAPPYDDLIVSRFEVSSSKGGDLRFPTASPSWLSSRQVIGRRSQKLARCAFKRPSTVL